jgi:ferrous iron transport protein A
VISLCQLARGQRATITRIDGCDNISQRLLEMGLLEGEAVEVIAVAPFGDPLEIRLRHGCLSVRRNEAARILVEPQNREMPADPPSR